ncbi:unnamed protein product [Diplocarpon coronariae]
MASSAMIMSDDEDNPTSPRRSCPGDGLRASPIFFHFGPQVAVAPETEYFKDYAVAYEKSRMPPGARALGILLNNNHRAAANKSTRGAATAWFDEDESGTYDPSQKRTPQTLSSLPGRVKRIKMSASDEDGNPKPKRPMKIVGYFNSLVIKLFFKSKEALEHLSTLPAGASRPAPYTSSDEDEQSEVNSDSESEGRRTFKGKRVVKKRARPARSDGLTIDQLTGGHPQRRGCVSCFEQENDECSLTHNNNYPCEACEDAGVDCLLIIPPIFKKACVHCKVKRQKCSYREDGGKGVDSCNACEEEGHVCCAAPLLNEGWIRRFSNASARPRLAKERGRPRSDSTSSPAPVIKTLIQERSKLDTGPCAGCRVCGQNCNFIHSRTRALEPAASSSSNKSSNGRKKKKVSIAPCLRKWEVESPSPQPSPVSCMGTPPSHSPNTSTATKFSELENNNGKESQASFEKGKQNLLSPCHPHTAHSYCKALLARRNITYVKSKNRNTDRDPQLGTQTLEMKHTSIVTAFCHPIGFNYIPDQLNKHPCSWCHNPFFGLWGLSDEKGPKNVEGFYHGNGGGFEEIFGGFSEAGYSRSVMCVRCTFNRVRATQCGSHRMRTLDPTKGEIDMRVFDDEKWRRAIQECTAGGNGSLVRKTKWCAICPATATTMCCAPQRFDAQGESGTFDEGGKYEGSGIEGCGLYLCEDCAVLLDKMVKGGARTGGRQLDTLVNHVKCNTWRYPEGVRADAPFLTSVGELLKRIEQGVVLAPSPFTSSSKSLRLSLDRKEVSKGFSDIGSGFGGPSQPDKGKGKDGLQISSFGPEFRGTENRKGEGQKEFVGMAWQQLSSRQAATHLARAAEKTFVSPSSSGVDSRIGPVRGKIEGISRGFGCGGSSGDSVSSEDRGYEYGHTHRRLVGAGGKSDHRGDILFGGLMEARKEDVERALGGQNLPIDSANE